MYVTVNGNSQTISNGASVGDLLRTLDVAAIRVAVEVNQELVRRTHYDETPLRDGDRVEIVTFVGGG